MSIKSKKMFLSFLLAMVLAATFVLPLTLSAQEGLKLTLEELAAFNGKDGQPAYVAVDGKIYDLSDSRMWPEGMHNGFEAGKELTEGIRDVSPHGEQVLSRFPQIGILVDAPANVPSSVFNPLGVSFRFLGWLSIVLAVIATSPWWLRKLNSWTVKTKDKRFLKLLKFLRPVHKVAGVLLALISLYHGYLALNGNLRLHTGSLLYISFLLTAILGTAHYFKKDKRAFKGHKVMALVSMLLFLLHLIKPWALGQWFGL